MTVANVSANKISTIPRQCHPTAITQMVMDGLHCPLGDATRSERDRKPRLLVINIANGFLFIDRDCFKHKQHTAALAVAMPRKP